MTKITADAAISQPKADPKVTRRVTVAQVAADLQTLQSSVLELTKAVVALAEGQAQQLAAANQPKAAPKVAKPKASKAAKKAASPKAKKVAQAPEFVARRASNREVNKALASVIRAAGLQPSGRLWEECKLHAEVYPNLPLGEIVAKAAAFLGVSA